MGDRKAATLLTSCHRTNTPSQKNISPSRILNMPSRIFILRRRIYKTSLCLPEFFSNFFQFFFNCSENLLKNIPWEIESSRHSLVTGMQGRWQDSCHPLEALRQRVKFWWQECKELLVKRRRKEKIRLTQKN